MNADDILRGPWTSPYANAGAAADVPPLKDLLAISGVFAAKQGPQAFAARPGVLESMIPGAVNGEPPWPTPPGGFDTLSGIPAYHFTTAIELLNLQRTVPGLKVIVTGPEDERLLSRVNAFLAVERWAKENGLPEPQMPEDW